MNEIANCPLCGKDVKKSIWRPEYEGCAGGVVITVKCCGIEATSITLWNQYAAAMELAKVCVAVDEAMRTDDDDDRITELYENFCNAESCVLEVFK